MSLKFSLVGMGHMGRIHARKLAQMKTVELSSIVDVNVDDAKEAADHLGTCFFSTCEDALPSGLCGAVVATTTDTHYRIVRELLEHGIHVLVEKPIASTPAQAIELIGLAKRKQLILQVGHLERFSSPFRKVNDSIHDPILIEAFRTSSYTGRSTDIDVVHDLMIHDIALAFSLVDSEVGAIESYGVSVLSNKIDLAHARIEFANGCVAVLTASRVSSLKERSFNVLQQDMYVALDLSVGNVYTAQKDDRGRFHVHTLNRPSSDSVQSELEAFVKAIKKEAAVIVTGEDGLRALTVADAIIEGMKESHPQKLSHVV
jgi:predicted dehydrogenase